MSWFAAGLISAGGLAGPAGPGPTGETQVLYDSWGAVFSGNHKIGHTHQRTVRKRGAAGRAVLVSDWETHLTFLRSVDVLELVERAEVREDPSGRVVAYRYEVSSYSGGERKTRVVVNGEREGDALVVESGGYTQRIPWSGEVLGPYRFHRVLLAKRAAGVSAFDAKVFLAELGRGVGVHVIFGPEEEKLLHSGRLRLQRVTQVMSAMPNRPEVLWLDSSGEIRVSESAAPFLGKVRIEQVDRETALTPASPVELMGAALIHSPAAIPAPRSLERAEYIVRYSAAAAARWPRGVGQSIEALGPGQVRIRVDAARAEAPGASASEVEGWEPESARDYLRPTAFLESDAPLIRRMAEEAVGEIRDPMAAARAIERYVRAEIHDKTLDMGFASALETARAKRGDCSEHAVLCAALARARGIPSRIVVGIAYVPDAIFGREDPRGFFVFHVWTELMVRPGRWLPIDAALGGFDATHIALTKSPLNSVSPLADLCLPVLDVVDRLRVCAVKIPGPAGAGEPPAAEPEGAQRAE